MNECNAVEFTEKWRKETSPLPLKSFPRIFAVINLSAGYHSCGDFDTALEKLRAISSRQLARVQPIYRFLYYHNLIVTYISLDDCTSAEAFIPILNHQLNFLISKSRVDALRHCEIISHTIAYKKENPIDHIAFFNK